MAPDPKDHDRDVEDDRHSGTSSGDFEVMEPPPPTPLEEAAVRSELAAKHRGEDVEEQALELNSNSRGTILEAAFVDPAYSWPPADGQGQNAIELQASLDLVRDDDAMTDFTTESMAARMQNPSKPVPVPPRRGFFSCCGKSANDAVVTPEQMREYEEQKQLAKEARRQHALDKKEYISAKEKLLRRKEKYNRVPEGILIYRLDTSDRTLQLLSPPHLKTDRDTLVEACLVERAEPANDKSRRGLLLTDSDGYQFTLTACEQRTATAWLEAIGLMDAKHSSRNRGFGFGGGSSSKRTDSWSHEKLKNEELNAIEDQYMNLAHYSHKLIRSGALPGTKKGAGGAGGIYYSIDKASNNAGEDNGGEQDESQEEALEAIAKRRAVIKDSWDFYRMICSLLRDRNKYEETFRRMQLDPVYPYLNSMTGLNDPGDVGYENLDKPVLQRDLPEYNDMTQMQVAQALCAKAQATMPSLVEICKALAGSLGMEEVGVGPVKEPIAAVRKAEKKYGGDLLKVTDYCRALLVVRDFPSLLALLELARDSFGPLITRVKMSSLKQDHKAKAGGYRDCIINLELKGHICEIQVHLWPMWIVCGVDGFRHYRHCVEYNTDSFDDAYDALDGLDRKTMAELIVMAEEAVADTPLDNLEWYHEKFILDYFAEAGLFMKHGLDVWAEITFRHLIRLRTESPDIGPNHHETVILYKYLAQTLRAQNKYDEAKEVMKTVHQAELAKKDEKKDAEKSMWDSLGEVYDMVVDPNRKEREEEQKFRQEVKQSKKHWRRIRQERFPFLDVEFDDVNNNKAVSENASLVEEKKVDEMVQ